MKTLIMLVGVPASGKSTYVNGDLHERYRDAIVLSTDNYIEKIANGSGITYSEAFSDNINAAQEQMYKTIAFAREHELDVIWDQTNLTNSSRKKKLAMFPDYYKIAVFFKTPNDTELTERLASREGKHIPENVVRDMIKSLEVPALSEGFNEIIML